MDTTKPRTLDPWERQAYDTEASWEVFLAYRDQAPPRKGLTILIKGRPVNPIQVSRWMVAHFWKERAAEYDRHLDGIRREEREGLLRQSVKEITADHMAVLAKMRDIALKEIAKLQATVDQSAGEIMRPRELTGFIEAVVKLDRLIRGESTENVQETGPDLSELSEADLATLEAIVNKGKANDPTPVSH